MNTAVLSVVIPVYNTANTLDRCVESVIHQAHGCEVVLVDDGSLDGGGVKCDHWAQQYSNIHVVHQSNQGLGAARNAGVRASSASFVTFVDSDDALAPGTLLGLLSVLEAHPEYDMLEYPIELHYASPNSCRLQMDGSCYTDWRRYWLDTRAYAHTYACNKVFSRHLFDYCLFPDRKAFEDVWFLPQVLPHCRYIATVNTGCYHYYDNPDGITHRATADDLNSLLEAHCKVLPLVNSADYYAQVVNIALDVYHATGHVPPLPRLHYWNTPKLLVNNFLGFRLLCLLHRLLKLRR